MCRIDHRVISRLNYKDENIKEMFLKHGGKNTAGGKLLTHRK
jgi:hypothetical protein